MPAPAGSVALSVVAPAHDEEANLRPLVAELAAALDPLHIPYEIVIVDDGSTDHTLEILRDLLREFRQLRGVRLQDPPPGRGHGQSAALHAGFRAARGALIAVLDADLQNDPADLPGMLTQLGDGAVDMVQGDRSNGRCDNLLRRISSRVGRFFRSLLLRDTIRDTGCSLRVLRRDVALALPLEFRGLHRFMPVMARHLGFTVVEVPVRHRPRTAGTGSYGVWNRALPALVDCFAVRWMHSRRRRVTTELIAERECALPRPAATVEIMPRESIREAVS